MFSACRRVWRLMIFPLAPLTFIAAILISLFFLFLGLFFFGRVSGCFCFSFCLGSSSSLNVWSFPRLFLFCAGASCWGGISGVLCWGLFACGISGVFCWGSLVLLLILGLSQKVVGSFLGSYHLVCIIWLNLVLFFWVVLLGFVSA